MDDVTEGDWNEEGNWSVNEAVIAGIYAFAVGVNVYLIADQLTDGQLTRSLSMSLSHLRGWLKQKWRQTVDMDIQVKRLYPYVLFDATTIVEEGAKE